jgi:hypothetical protein
MDMKSAIKNGVIRERLQDLLRPYDFANLLRATNSKPTEYEKRVYLTPMNELFHTEILYPILDRNNTRIAVVGKNLVKMEIQLNVSSKSWNKHIYSQRISVLAIVVYAGPIIDIYDKDIVRSIRFNGNINISFYCVSAANRKIHRDLLCITDMDLKLVIVCPDRSTTVIGHISNAHHNDVYDPMRRLSEYKSFAVRNLISKYSNRYSEVYDTCYVTNVEAELGVTSVCSGNISIPTDLEWRRTWSSLVLVMDCVDLSGLCNEVLATGILIPFSFRTF